MKIFITQLLLMLLVPFVSSASHSIYYDGLYFEYNLEANQLSVEGDFLSHENHYFGNIVIPSEVPTDKGVLPVTMISSKAFYQSNITSVVIPGSVNFISDDAFGECHALTSTIFGNGLEVIGYRAFRDCPLLEKIILPESLKCIKSQAFEGCINLKTVELPSSINETSYDLPGVGQSCFKNCANLEAINLPDGMLSITESLFENCTSLKKLVIPSSVHYIKSRAFYGSGIEGIIIPSLVERIYWEAFLGCKNLGTVIIESGDAIGGFSELHLMGNFGCDYFFDDSIQKLYVGKIVETNNYVLGCPFKGLSNVTNFEFGPNVRVVEEHLFEGMTSLQKLVIPANMEYIRNYAFYGFGEDDSKSVECIGCKAASLAPNAFSDACYSQCQLIVPSESEEFYRNAFVWKNFRYQKTDLISPIEDNISILTSGLTVKVSSPCPVRSAIYMLNGSLISVSNNGILTAPSHGIYILAINVDGKEKITKIYL